MSKLKLSLYTLPAEIQRLRTVLADLRLEADLWPLCELSGEDYHTFMNDLYVLAKDCLAMRWEDRVLPHVYFIGIFGAEPAPLIPDLIRLTRELIWCCDTDLIHQYRELRTGEYEIIRLLEQTHAQLIGKYYGDHPGRETLAAHELHFCKDI